MCTYRLGRRNISNIWNSCLQSLPKVSNWIAWSLGNGAKFHIDKDSIVGSNNQYKFSDGLLWELHGNGYFFSNKAYIHNRDREGGRGWQSVEASNLNFQYKEEWSNYLKMLRFCGVALNDSEDSMKLTWNITNGFVTTKLAYEAISLEKKKFETIGGIMLCGSGTYL